MGSRDATASTRDGGAAGSITITVDNRTDTSR
ncbi:MAG: hypothetical protein CM15mP122_5320 [Bacteroidota bacterium]|nr:MAG: hypothetical protein CM15mP122_5320 [Bacteroidota bacterium]